MAEQRPDVTVVVPVHNGQRYLANAIDSAIAQTGVNLEIIVVDDASNDATPHIAASYGSRVRYLRLPKQPTSIATTNTGLAAATGRFVAVLHHDDLYRPGKLRRHVDLMTAYPYVMLSYSAQHYVGPRNRLLATMRSPLQRGTYVVPGVTELRHLVVQNYINFSNAVVRRDAYDRLGSYEVPLWVSAEWPMWIRLALLGDVGYIDAPLTCYRLHSGAQTLARTRDTQDYLAQLLAAVERIYTLPELPPALMTTRRISEGNAYFNTALLQVLHREWKPAAHSFGQALHRIGVRDVRRTAHSSVIGPRLVSRLRLLTGGGDQALPEPGAPTITAALESGRSRPPWQAQEYRWVVLMSAMGNFLGDFPECK